MAKAVLLQIREKHLENLLKPYYKRNLLVYAAILVAACVVSSIAEANEYKGQVRFNGFAVPGATVVATQGEKRLETTSDASGRYDFADLGDGTWKLHVELPGFTPLDTEVEVAAKTSSTTLELKMLPLDLVLALAMPQTAVAPAVLPPVPDIQADPKLKAGVNPADESAKSPASEPSSEATDGLLVNGSNNNAATSLFSLDRAFGNQRNSSRSLYNGGLAVIADNSIFDARPYSLSGVPQPKSNYSNVTEVLTFGGPLNIPHLLNGRTFHGPNFSLVYQRTRNREQASETGLVPTTAQRASVVDPVADALLAYYPLPNIAGGSDYNFQTQVLNNTHVDALQLRMDRSLKREEFSGSVATESTRQDATNLFGFRDATDILGVNAGVKWQHRLRQGLYLDVAYRFSRLRTEVRPFFANRVNVSGNAGLTGTLQDARDWGPPTLVFSSGIASLTDGQSAFNRNRSDNIQGSVRWYRGRHNITVGGDFRREKFNYLTQQDPRGTFTFTGTALGSDFADFSHGVADTASINYGNADKYLRHLVYDAYVADDWHLLPELSLNLGVRYEYGAPLTELKQRLVNYDVASGFSEVATVLASDPVGPLTGQHYPTSLLRPDRSHVEPRIGLAWRPVPGSSLVVRAGYGIYSDTSAYQNTTLQLAEQSPFATSLSVNNTDCAQTLRTGPTSCTSTTTNTFAADPNFRIGYAQTWNFSAQRDFPGALLVTTSYLGVKGTHGVQDFLPNTNPIGAANPCPQCPVGFRYRSSNGNSERNAGTLQVRRRLRSGFTATLEYTYSRSVDDDSILGGQGTVSPSSASSTQTSSDSASGTGTATIAQDWRNLRGERGLSTFDQRNLLRATAQYTTGMGQQGGTLLSGWRGRVYKEWTVLLQANLGRGLPETPVYLAAVPNTGFTGSIRPNRNIADPYSGGAGHFFNAAAFAAPQAGAWGNAGRDSLRGPGTYSFNGSLSRTFRIEKKYNLDIRADATNLLNHVVYTSYNNVINPTLDSPLFGVPTAAGPMRSIQFTGRLRF